jgi:hypothetical protein
MRVLFLRKSSNRMSRWAIVKVRSNIGLRDRPRRKKRLSYGHWGWRMKTGNRLTAELLRHQPPDLLTRAGSWDLAMSHDDASVINFAVRGRNKARGASLTAAPWYSELRHHIRVRLELFLQLFKVSSLQRVQIITLTEFYTSWLADKCIQFSGTRIVYCRERAFDTESDTYHNLGTSTMTKALPTMVPSW